MYKVLGIIFLYTGAIVTGVTVTPEGMVFIPEGEFLKGTTREQAAQLAQEYDADVSLFTEVELPQTKVNVKAFYIDRYEVTNQKYQLFLKATGHVAPSGWKGTEYPEGQADYPITGVNWNDAKDYAEWVGKRLPTENEWEKAARGTDGKLYPWGNYWKQGACCRDEAKKAGDNFGPAPVGSYPEDVSPYGVYDLAGNVTEWTADLVRDSQELPPFWTSFPTIKGGHFALSQPYNFRGAARSAEPSGNGPCGYIGFRCALDALSMAYAEETLSVPDPPKVSACNQNRGKLPVTKPELYRTTPITIFDDNWYGMLCLHVPYLPNDRFALQILENIPGIDQKGLPWQSASLFEFNPDHTVATRSWTEPADKPGRLQIAVKLHGESDCVTIIYKVKNLGTAIRSWEISTCFIAGFAPNFRDHEGVRTFLHTQSAFVPLNKIPRQSLGRIYGRTHFTLKQGVPTDLPFFAIVSRDGQWVISEAQKEAASMFNNLEYSCQHASPLPYELTPGQEKEMRQKLYFLQGQPQNLVERWRHDFP